MVDDNRPLSSSPLSPSTSFSSFPSFREEEQGTLFSRETRKGKACLRGSSNSRIITEARARLRTKQNAGIARPPLRDGGARKKRGRASRNIYLRKRQDHGTRSHPTQPDAHERSSHHHIGPLKVSLVRTVAPMSVFFRSSAALWEGEESFFDPISSSRKTRDAIQ